MLHTGGVDEETWHVKNATKDRKAKEMGEFPGIYIVPHDVHVLWT